MSKNGLTREENRKAWLYAFLIVLGMGAVAALLVWSRSWNMTPVELRETNPLVTEAARGLDEITVDASFDPVARTLAVEQRMTLYNRTGETLPQAVVRSWTGAYLAGETSPCTTNELYWSCYPEGFDPGGPALESLAVNGQAVEAQWLDDAQTALSLTVEGGWAPEASVTLAIDYRVDIPRCASRFGETEGIWALGNVFMLPALYEDGAWRTEAYLSVGDPFQSACANWTVRLTLPQGYTAAASGWGEALRVGDVQTVTFESEAVRDFALVISDGFQMAQGMAGDTLVTAYARDAGKAREMVKYAQQALETFGESYGTYLYPSLTLAEVDFPFGGMEYPRMVMMGSSLVEAGGQDLELTVAHEVAHQWWYAMVGSDSYYQPWQDESLCEYAVMDYVGQWYGAQAREDFRVQRVEAALRTGTAQTVTPGSPIDYFANLEEYTLVCYRRGAALWTALEMALGKEQLDGFLHTYVETYRFGRATREDLTRLLTDYTRQDWSALISDYLDTRMN